jgi:hypothetical protein
LPGLTDKCFESLIRFLTSLSSENISENISDISGALSLACGGNDKISFEENSVTDNTEVVLIKSPDSSFLFPFNYYNGDYFVLQSVLNIDGSQAIDFKTYKTDKNGFGIYGKVSPKKKSGYINFKLEAIYFSENSTGPKPLSISSLAIKHRRTLICKLLRGGTGSGGKGGGNGGKGGEGGGSDSESNADAAAPSSGSGGGDGSVDTASDKAVFQNLLKNITDINKNIHIIYFYIDNNYQLMFQDKSENYSENFTSTNNKYNFRTRESRWMFFVRFYNQVFLTYFTSEETLKPYINFLFRIKDQELLNYISTVGTFSKIL